MMWEWTAEQTIQITTTDIDLEFLPSETNVDRSAKPGVRYAADAHSTHDSHEL